jgi:hypothetical protein
MSAPTQIIERKLTFTFAQSISTVTGVPDVMEVAVIPLTDGPTAQATYAGGLKTAEVELSEPQNTVDFELIPSNSPGLDQAINYRVMWRANINSRTYTYDFQMPDADLTWGQLTAGVGGGGWHAVGVHPRRERPVRTSDVEVVHPRRRRDRVD